MALAADTDFLSYNPGQRVRFVLDEGGRDEAPIVLYVQLLDRFVPAPATPPTYWWEFTLRRGYMLLCELRTYNHLLARPVLSATMDDALRLEHRARSVEAQRRVEEMFAPKPEAQPTGVRMLVEHGANLYPKDKS